MDDQHKLIKGYRDLTQEEIDLMNEIKAEGERLRSLVDHVTNHVESKHELADPHRWAAIGKTDLQTGIMALVRAVAQPESF